MDFNNPQLVNLISQSLWLIIAIIIIDLVVRAIALWQSARNSQKVWFICLTVFNTLGILPLIYLLFFSKPQVKPTR